LTTTALVVAETGWILNRQLGPAADSAFYRSIADGEIITEPSRQRFQSARRASTRLS